jgi:hypothetical protein
MMRQMAWSVAAACVWAVGTMAAEQAANTAEPEASQLETSVDLGVYSAYVWRGQVINDEPVLQPQLNLELDGFALHAWGNVDLTDNVNEDAPAFSEVDLTAAYTRQFGPVELTGSYTHYLLINQTLETEVETIVDGKPEITTVSEDAPSTGEICLEASLPDLTVVPTLCVVRDVKEANGFYGSLGAATAFDLLKETLSLDVSASLGAGDADYNAYYFGVDDAALNDATASASLTWTACECFSLSPGVQYSVLVDDAVRDGAEEAYGHKDAVVGSLSMTYSF